MRRKKDMPLPKGGSRRFFYLLWNHFWTLVKLNLFMIVFSLPVVTIPAAICAADRVAVQLARNGYVLLWEEFRDEFKADFFRSLPLGLLFGGMVALSYVMMSIGLGNSGSYSGMVILALGILLLYHVLSCGSYAFLLRAMLSLNNWDVLKNARILSICRGGRGALAAAMGLGGIVISYALFPFTLLLVASFGLGIYRFCLCYLLNKPIQEKVIAPWEQLQESEEVE